MSGRNVFASFRWIKTAAAVAAMAWCLAAAVYNVRTAWNPRHPIADLEAQFSALIPHLPTRGEVGFLEHHDAPGTADAARTWYTAQYALSPRLVVSRLGPEFLIVAAGTAHPDGDRRLEGYVHIHTVPGRHQLYRRLVQ